jgi:hypothetical protein
MATVDLSAAFRANRIEAIAELSTATQPEAEAAYAEIVGLAVCAARRLLDARASGCDRPSGCLADPPDVLPVLGLRATGALASPGR